MKDINLREALWQYWAARLQREIPDLEPDTRSFCLGEANGAAVVLMTLAEMDSTEFASIVDRACTKVGIDAFEEFARLYMLHLDGITTQCAGCGEYWPCSISRNRGAYHPDVAAAHYPKVSK